MSDNPIKLWPGPCVDGRETYFARGGDIQPGWQRRVGSKDPWTSTPIGRASDVWYQVRPPAKLPDPHSIAVCANGDLVVLWREMGERADLHEWEVLTYTGAWERCDDLTRPPRRDGYPIRIRRKETST